MDGQTVIVLLVVGFAIWRLVRRGLAVLNPVDQQACGSCSSCSVSNESQARLIKLHELGEAPPGPAESEH